MISFLSSYIISDFSPFEQIFWLLIPPGIANLIPPLATKLWPRLDYPLDFYLAFKGERILGDHKTFRGALAGVFAATVTYEIQKQLMNQYDFLARLDTYEIFKHGWWVGSFLGFIALFSDTIKSFFKRRINLEPGESWFPLDQIDWVLGSCLAFKLFVPIRVSFVLIAISEGFTLSVAMKYLGYLVGVNDQKI